MLALGAWAQDFPKWEIGIDGSGAKLYPNKTDTVPNTAFSRNLYGGGGNVTYNFTKWFGLKGDVQGYASKDFTLIPALGGASVKGNLVTYMGGPVFKYRTRHFEPFGQVLVGGVHSSLFENTWWARGSTGGKPSNSAFGLLAGGGLDIPLTRHFAIRPIEVDYLLTHYSNQFTNNSTQNNFRYAAGIVARFGGAPPAVPSATCSASPAEVLPDQPVTVTMQAANLNPKHHLAYKWTTNGGKVTPEDATAKIDTTGVAPGAYAVEGTVTDPKQKTNNTATCTAPFTVKAPRPPEVTCSANPASIDAGSGVPVTITIQGSSPDGRKIVKREFSTSAGAVQEGQSTAGAAPGQFTTTATLDTKGVQSGPIDVKVVATDDAGMTGGCNLSIPVNVTAPPPAAESSLGECTFHNAAKPARVDNECKGLLDDAAGRLQREPSGKLIALGCAEANEKGNLDAQRAVNIKYYLSSGEGQQHIDPSRIEARQGCTDDQKGKLFFLPEGATFSQAQSTTVVDESKVQPQGRTAAPVKKHHKAKKSHKAAAAPAEAPAPAQP